MSLSDLKRKASSLQMSDMHDLQGWLQMRIAETERSRVVLDIAADSRVLAERKVGSGYLRLEAPRCKRKTCAVCSAGGAHAPRWFVYFYDRGGKLKSAYVGEFDIGPFDLSPSRLATNVEIRTNMSY